MVKGSYCRQKHVLVLLFTLEKLQLYLCKLLKTLTRPKINVIALKDLEASSDKDHISLVVAVQILEIDHRRMYLLEFPKTEHERKKHHKYSTLTSLLLADIKAPKSRRRKGMTGLYKTITKRKQSK